MVHFCGEPVHKKNGRGGRVKRGLEIRIASDEEEKGPRMSIIPGNLRGRGREGVRTPNSYAALPSTPVSVQAGMEWSVRGEDHVISELRAHCAT
jgi:hypothetical protein